MPRAFLIVMDSVGCGGAPDAADFGDEGGNTLGHIHAACAASARGPLKMPVLAGLGLWQAVELASGYPAEKAQVSGLWGAATEVSRGKDTPSGHWELAGVPVPWDWTYFPTTVPCFPPDLVAEVCRLAGVSGILGNCHASGVPIIERLGAEHMRTGWPICYTSADSVFQIAAHEETFGLQRLHDLCAAIAPRLHGMRVGRVIARPFVGSQADGFTRTGNRHDYAMATPSPTLLNRAQEAGISTIAVGKIGDIFSMSGIDRLLKGADDVALFEQLMRVQLDASANSFTFANFVEFDSRFGHRRDVMGYAGALEWFDAAAGRFLAGMKDGDMVIFTADHGNDPTWQGTDHTRERVPVLVAGAGSGSLGLIGFADVAGLVARHLGLDFP